MDILLKTPLYLLVILVLTLACEPEEKPRIPSPGTKGHGIINEIVNASSSPLNVTHIEFKTALEQSITIENTIYRPVLDEVQLLNGDTEISGELLVADDGLSADFFPTELLPENSLIKVRVEAHWEYEEGANWVAVSEGGVEVKQSDVQISFSDLPVEMIKSNFPADGATNQSVVTNPRVSFIYNADESKSILPIPVPIRLIFDGASFQQAGNDVPASISLSTAKDFAEIQPEAILASETEYTVTATAHWERQQGQTWKPILKNGENVGQTIQYSFTTKAIGSTTQILTDNIEHSYPIANQYHFLKLEHDEGFFKLRTNRQNDLFETTGVQFKARFSTPDNDPIEVPFTYDPHTLLATYAIPTTLLNETIYQLELLKVATGSGNTEVLHILHFRTSMYNTFNEKINNFNFEGAASWGLQPGVDELNTLINDHTNELESFDLAEVDTDSINEIMEGAAHSIGLVQIELLPESDYYADYLHPIIYERYQDFDFTITRNTNAVPVPPLNANYIYTPTGQRILLEEEIANNTSTRITSWASLRFTVAAFAAHDWMELRNQAANHPDAMTNEYLKRLVEQPFPNVKQGRYAFLIKYVLPGGHVTTEVERELIWTIN